jgi:hypothetical protein
MSSITTSVAVFVCILGGVLLGILGRTRLPDNQQTPETKEVVRLGMGLVGTMVALVLGLLITSAKAFYETQNSEVTEAAANTVLLDRILAHYGPETRAARELLRSSIARQMDLIGQRDDSVTPQAASSASSSEALFDRIQDLSPKTDSQRLLQTQALGLAIKLGQVRWLMFEQKTSPLPTPLLAILVFWLTFLFMSFGLFVRPNATVVTSLLISALAVTAAIFLILEMYQPYVGLIRVSTAPLRAAIEQLGQ